MRIIACIILFILTQISYAENYLLKPTGEYHVGFQDIFLINSDICPDSFYHTNLNEKDFDSANKKYCHEIVLRVYYPTSKRPKQYDKYYAPYLITENNWITNKYPLTKQESVKLNTILDVRTYTKADVKPIVSGQYPVIIFSPGSGSSTQIYTNLISNLVSHGYIVIGVNSMFINGPLKNANGHVIQPPDSYLATVGREENISDLKFIIRHLKSIPFKYNLIKHMNFDNIGLMGHSRGGMSITQLLNQYPINLKIKAIILMDPGNGLGTKNYPLNLPNIPTLVIWSATFKEEMHGSIISKQNVGDFVLQNDSANMDYSNHNNFCDLSTLQYHSAYSNTNVRKELTVGTGNGFEIAKMINNKVLRFFNENLNK